MSLWKSQPPAESGAPGSGNLYHKQQVPPRRRVELIQQLDAGPRPRAKSTSFDPARHTFMSSVRMFVIVIAAMIVLLMLSMKMLNLIWRAKDEKILAPHAAPASAEPEEAVRKKSEPPATDDGGITISTKRGPEQDAHTMRKALMLAKRADALAAGGFAAEAIERYREALTIWPNLPNVWAQLGRLYLQAKDYPRAQAALEKAVSTDTSKGTASVLNDLAVTFIFQERPDRAIPLLETATSADPEFAPSFFNLALCHLSRNDQRNALEALNRYLELEPDDARALRERAFLDAAATNYPEAMESLERAIAQAPEWPLLYLDAAAVAALMGKSNEAISYMRKAEPLTSASTVYRLYQQKAFASVRNTDEGKSYAKELASRVNLQALSAETIQESSSHAFPIPSFSAEAMP